MIYPRAFTFLELLIVLGLLTFIASVALPEGMNSYNRALKRDDRTLIVSVLSRAREEAMTGQCRGNCTGPIAYGVHTTLSDVVLFQGQNYAARDTRFDDVFPLSMPGAASSTDDVIFAPLSGEARATSTFSIATQDGASENVVVNEAGGITTE